MPGPVDVHTAQLTQTTITFSKPRPVQSSDFGFEQEENDGSAELHVEPSEQHWLPAHFAVVPGHDTESPTLHVALGDGAGVGPGDGPGDGGVPERHAFWSLIPPTPPHLHAWFRIGCAPQVLSFFFTVTPSPNVIVATARSVSIVIVEGAPA